MAVLELLIYLVRQQEFELFIHQKNAISLASSNAVFPPVQQLLRHRRPE
jgi:hypothetical protein